MPFDIKVFPFLVELSGGAEATVFCRVGGAMASVGGLFYIGFVRLTRGRVKELRWNLKGEAQGASRDFDIKTLLRTADYDSVWRSGEALLGSHPAKPAFIINFRPSPASGGGSTADPGILIGPLPPCMHEWVNVSFNGFLEACRLCGEKKTS